MNIKAYDDRFHPESGRFSNNNEEQREEKMVEHEKGDDKIFDEGGEYGDKFDETEDEMEKDEYENDEEDDGMDEDQDDEGDAVKEIQSERNSEFEIEEENIINNFSIDDIEDISNHDKNGKDEDQQENINNYIRNPPKLPEIENLSDLNQIINDFPQTTSFLFPLLNIPSAANEKNNDTSDDMSNNKTKNVDGNEDAKRERINDFIIFQPFNERFRERYDEYLQSRYVRIGQQLYSALVDECHFWRHIFALSGFYFMQQGESMHRLCDNLFEKVSKYLFTSSNTFRLSFFSNLFRFVDFRFI